MQMDGQGADIFSFMGCILNSHETSPAQLAERLARLFENPGARPGPCFRRNRHDGTQHQAADQGGLHRVFGILST